MPRDWLSNKEYDFIFGRIPRLCVDLVIKGSRGVLLTKRKIYPYKNFWHLPGGRMKFREPFKKAIGRIAREEVGLKVKVLALAGFMEFLRETQNRRKRHSVSLVFLVRPLSKVARGSWQAEEIKYYKNLSAQIHPIHLKFLSRNRYLR